MSCITPTRNRPEWLAKAILCYQRQTYQRKELLILESGDAPGSIPDDPTIHYWHEPNARRTVGAARNWLCERARGEVVCHFDDDDWSAPERVADQIARLAGHSVTGYRSLRFTDGSRWWLYSGHAGYALGTSLCYRREFWARNRFPDDKVGEDNAFVHRALAEKTLATAEAGDLMYATIHEGNTSPRHIYGRDGRIGSSWREL